MYRYTITDEEYLEMGKWMLMAKRGTGAKAVVSILLRTVIQMGAVACLIIFMPEAPTWMKWMLGILSVIWALLALFQHSFPEMRARMLLQQSKNSRDGAEYWKEHHLNAGGDSFRLSYGNARLELPYERVTEMRETDRLYIIRAGKDIFEAVPKRAVPEGEWAKIAENALSARDRIKREALEGLRGMLEKEAPFKARVRLTQDEMAEKVVKMTRRSLRYTCGWSILTAFTFFFPLGLGVYTLLQGGSWATVALCIGTFILFNMRLFAVFMPVAKDMMKRKLMAPAEDGYLLAVKDKTAFLVGEDKAFTYALSDLRKCVGTEDGLYVYFVKQAMLYVPVATADGFLAAAGLKKSLHTLAAAQGTVIETDLPEDLPEAPADAPEAADAPEKPELPVPADEA